MLKKAPEVPVASVWVPTLIPFNVVMPTAAVGDHVNPVADDALAVNTKLSVPTFNLINVLPAPTKMSPLVYELYPVPP